MRLRDGGCSSPTTSCGTPAILHRSSARDAPGLHRRFASSPIFIPATSPSPCFAKARTKRVPAARMPEAAAILARLDAIMRELADLRGEVAASLPAPAGEQLGPNLDRSPDEGQIAVSDDLKSNIQVS